MTSASCANSCVVGVKISVGLRWAGSFRTASRKSAAALFRESESRAVAIATCPAWRRAVDAGGYRYVVTTFDPYLPYDLKSSPEGRWTGTDPAAEVVVSEPPVRVYRLTGPLDPAGCDGIPPLRPALRHRVPNLRGAPAPGGTLR